MTGIRLLSYNIRSMRDDRQALARVIQGCRPDIVCVQEAPRFLLWRAKRHCLARHCGLKVVVGKRPAGLELLVGPRVSVVHKEHHLLSRMPGLHRRGVVIGVFVVDGHRLIVASTHLDLAAEPRRVHVEEILTLLESARQRFPAPITLAGDMNEEPSGQAWGTFAERFQDGYAVAPSGGEYSFSSQDPRRRIDAVFADPSIEVIRCGVPIESSLVADYPRATDHRPVLAQLELR